MTDTVDNFSDESLTLKKITDKILLVDDNENLLASIKRQFRKQINLDTANSGLSALECIKNKGPYAVVISDMQMPEMDGIEFLSQVRELSDKTIRIMLTGNANMDVAIDGINKGNLFRFLTKPIAKESLLDAIMDGLAQYHLVSEHEQLFNINKKQMLLLKDLNQNLEDKVKRRTADIKQANKTLKQQNIEVIMTFSRLIELRSGVDSHAKYIAKKASFLGKKMGMSEKEEQDTLIAGLLLEIGKMSLVDSLLTRPFRSLNKLERQSYLQHVVEGQRLLSGIKHLQQPARYIRHQHERYNGTGFPDGLKGNKIPLASRILCVVQDYIHYIYGGIHAKKMMNTEVLSLLKKNSGHIYDPKVVDEFLESIGDAHAIPQTKKIHWADLKEGMFIDKVVFRKVLYAYHRSVTKKLMKDINQLADEAHDQLDISIRVDHD